MSDEKKVSNAPPPITPIRGGMASLPRRPTTARAPDWDFWRNMPAVKIWQGCALSLNIDPDSMKHSRHGGIAGSGNGPSLEPQSFPSKDVEEQFGKRLRLACANIMQLHPQNLVASEPSLCGVELADFAAWAVSKMKWSGLPPELKALVGKANAQTDAPAETSNDDAGNSEQDEPAADAESTKDNEALSALFDPVPVEALEKMFPSGDKWRAWKEKASSNGLIDARIGRAMFNPYKAGIWFVTRGMEGWDLARCHRTLANNLPARSLDEKHLLTGDPE